MSKFREIQWYAIFTIFIHIVIWLLVIHLQFNLFGLYDALEVAFFDGLSYVDEAFIVTPSLIILFYLNSNYLVPTFLNRHFWWKYLIFLVGGFLLLFYFGYFIFFSLIEADYESGHDDPIAFFDHSLVLHLIVVGISTSLGISKVAIRTVRQKEQAEQMQKEAELKYLNAQFNPHFLYNTLNGIYAQALEEKAEKTTELILQLSEIMRYPIQNVAQTHVFLTEEIAFIDDYITLQKVRLGEDYPIVFTKEGNLSQLKVPPFILISLVENAFKYGVSQKNKTPISFLIKIENNTLFFRAQNTNTNPPKTKSHLVGINNLQSRLNLEYGQNQDLKIFKNEGTFTAELTINEMRV